MKEYFDTDIMLCVKCGTYTMHTEMCMKRKDGKYDYITECDECGFKTKKIISDDC